jgi:hypothetical protein
MASLDDEIDRLYQLPLDTFTAERNALAKRAGAQGAGIRQLAKPPIAAWAVNQVYWQQRKTYDALVAAAEEVRSAHKAVLGGRRADLRALGKRHDEAVDAALKAALGLLAGSGHPVTDATRQAVANTLRAVPGDEPDGRLTSPLQPGGFEMLAGVTPAARPAARQKAQPAGKRPVAETEPPARAGKAAKPSPAALARARAAAASAGRAVREAEHTVRREEFEAARAVRDAEKAARSLDAARRALDQAQRELDDAEAEAASAEEARDEAANRAVRAQEALDAARGREQAAQRDLDALTGS